MQNDKRHAMIRDGLQRKGHSLTSVAKILGVRPQSVVIVSQGHRKSEKIHRALSNALDVDIHELFPEFYPKEGSMK